MSEALPAPHALSFPRLVRSCAWLGASLALLAPGVSAQGPDGDPAPLRQGVHFAVGAGAGSIAAACDGCDVDVIDDRLTGFSGVLQLGGAVSNKLVIAGEFVGWVRNEAPIYRRMAAINLVFLGYPSETSGFFVKGGAGVSRAVVEDDFVSVVANSYTAVGGIGVDISAGSVMFTPYANFIRAFGGETQINGFVSPVLIEPNTVQIGIALTVH